MLGGAAGIFAALLCMSSCMQPGNAPKSAREQILADPLKACGVYSLYDFDNVPEPTPAPEGYSCVMLSHYGRHGARYLDSYYYIEKCMPMLELAHRDGMLTELGESLYERMVSHVKRCSDSLTLLTSIGYGQHRRIAADLVATYPEVLSRNPRVIAISTHYRRCVESMGAFCGSLASLCPSLEISRDSGPQYEDELCPHLSSNPNFKGVSPSKVLFTRLDEWGKHTLPTFCAEVVPCRDIICRIFKDFAYVREWDEPDLWCYSMFNIAMNAHDISGACSFDDIFTTEEKYGLWRVENFSMYNCFGPGRYQDLEAFEYFIRHADEDLKSEVPVLRLRFGHDTIIATLLWMLNADHMGEKPSDALHIEDYFQTYRITMAATLILAFYRNDEGDVLVRCTLNGRELSLPDLEAVSGPYYRWTELRDRSMDFVEAHRLRTGRKL